MGGSYFISQTAGNGGRWTFEQISALGSATLTSLLRQLGKGQGCKYSCTELKGGFHDSVHVHESKYCFSHVHPEARTELI